MTDVEIAAIHAIAQDVTYAVDDKIRKAKFDKSYMGVISEILFKPDTDIKDVAFGQYKVTFGGMEKNIRIDDGIVHTVGERVNVYMYENNPNRIYVEPIIKRVLPETITFDNDKNTITELRKIKTNDEVFEIKSVFTLTVENKGTENENVTKMTFPDGQEVNFVGWDV